MTSYERMIEQLRSTELYKLDGNSMIEKEFEAYCFYFNILNKVIDKLINNCFFDPITEKADTNYRALYNISDYLYSEEVEQLVKKRLALTNNDFTKDGVIRCIESGGFKVTLEENLSTKTITVTINEDLGTFGTIEEKEDFIKACLPCHVNVTFIWNV